MHMPFAAPVWVALACLTAACGASNRTPPAVEQVRIPIETTEGQTSLEAFVYRPGTPGPHPVMIWSHGSAGGDPKATLPAKAQAEFFASRGLLVVVPMRRGRGNSGGVSLEGEEKNCDTASWEPGVQTAYQDITAAIDYAAKLPDADAGNVVLAGASRGGFLSVGYASEGEHRDDIAGVVNFSGGWVAQAEDQCPTDYNQMSFLLFGAFSPTWSHQLWLYGADDPFYGDGLGNYAAAFAQRGGKAQFEIINGVPGNGHMLAEYPDLWRDKVDAYFKRVDLPIG